MIILEVQRHQMTQLRTQDQRGAIQFICRQIEADPTMKIINVPSEWQLLLIDEYGPERRSVTRLMEVNIKDGKTIMRFTKPTRKTIIANARTAQPPGISLPPIVLKPLDRTAQAINATGMEQLLLESTRKNLGVDVELDVSP